MSARWPAVAAFVLTASVAALVLWLRRSKHDPPPLPIPSASSTAEASASPDVLVWAGQVDDQPDESVRTYWLSIADGGLRVVGAHQGVVVLHQGRAWRWTPTEKQVEPCVCDGAPVAGKGSSVGADLVSIDSAERVTVIPPPDICNAEGMTSSVTLLGSLGPLLFVRSDHSEYGCGAHGFSVPRFVVFDIATATPVDLLRSVEVTQARRIAERELATADGGTPDQPPGLADLELVTLQPVFGNDGRMSLHGGFKTWACHACTGATRFVWGQYSRGVLVPVDELPKALSSFELPPAQVRWFIAARPRLVVGGYSSVASGETMPAAVNKTFQETTR